MSEWRKPWLKKKLGQHHLRESSLCRPLIDDLDPADRLVLEVGPGGGVLTDALLERGARVWAIEVDLSWAAYLQRRRRDLGEADLSVVVADAGGFPWSRLPVGTLVAGNLPFNVGTRIILSVLEHHRVVDRAGFMVQHEVAERLIAPPGTKQYGAFTVLVAARAHVSWLGTVAAGSFVPPPKVAGAFVGLRLRPPPVPEAEMDRFVELVHGAFAYRRKTLGNNLGRLWSRSRALVILKAAGIDPRVRAEELALGDFVKIFEATTAEIPRAREPSAKPDPLRG